MRKMIGRVILCLVFAATVICTSIAYENLHRNEHVCIPCIILNWHTSELTGMSTTDWYFLKMVQKNMDTQKIKEVIQSFFSKITEKY